MEMTDQIREHLEDTLKAYTQSIEGVEEFIENHKKQLDGALQHKETVVTKIANLKELLGITDDDAVETETPEPVEA